MKHFRRTILIGDVHGCIDELQELAAQLEIGSRDQVILLGDLIGKGPDSLSCIEYVRSRSFLSLLGNHEFQFREKIHKQIQGQEGITEGITQREPAKWPATWRMFHRHFDWLDSLPWYVVERNFITVHAGFIPALGIRHTPLHWLLNIRELPRQKPDNIADNIADYGKACAENGPEKPWFHDYCAAKPVYFGHWAKLGYTMKNNCTCLDTGCVYGGSLSAVVIPTSGSTGKLGEKILFQLPAKKAYCPINGKCTP